MLTTLIRQGYSEYQSVQIDILKFQKYVKHVKRRKIYSLRKWFNEPLVVGCGQSSDYWLWVKSVHISSLENKCNINIRQAWFYTGFMGCSGIFLLVNFDVTKIVLSHVTSSHVRSRHVVFNTVNTFEYLSTWVLEHWAFEQLCKEKGI